jgi:hypothetical protein
VYFPVITMTPLYFDAHRGPALRIVLSGAGFGGLALAPIVRALITAAGTRGALRWLGLMNLAISFPISFVAKSRDLTAGSTQLVNWRVARRKIFLFDVLSI